MDEIILRVDDIYLNDERFTARFLKHMEEHHNLSEDQLTDNVDNIEDDTERELEIIRTLNIFLTEVFDAYISKDNIHFKNEQKYNWFLLIMQG